MADEILLDVVLQGQQAVTSALQSIGRVGQQALSSLESSADRSTRALTGLSDSAGQTSARLQVVSRSGEDAARGVAAAGEEADRAGDKAEQSGSKFGTLLRVLAGLGAAAIGAGVAVAEAAKHAASGALDLQKAADDSGVDLETYQKLDYVFQQIGYSADESKDMIKAFGKNVDASADDVEKATTKVSDLRLKIEALNSKNSDLSFLNTLGNPELYGSSKDVERLVQYREELSKLQKQYDAAQRDLQTKQLFSQLNVTNGDDQIKQFEEFVRRLEMLPKEAQAAFSKNVLGVDITDKLGSGIETVEEKLKRLHTLVGEGVTDNMVEAAKQYRSAVSEFSTVSQIGRIQFGATFLPVVTKAISGFTSVLAEGRVAVREWARDNQDVFRSWADNVRRFVGDAAHLLSGLFSGNDSGGGGFGGQSNKPRLILASYVVPADDVERQVRPTISIMDRLRSAVESIGSAVRGVVLNVVIPAFAGLERAARVAADAVSAVFGVKLSATEVALGATLTYLTGGFTSLSVAVLALLGNLSSTTIEKFKTKLSEVGVSFDNIKRMAQNAVTVIEGLFNSNMFGSFKVDAKIVGEAIVALAAAFVLVREGAGLLAPVLEGVVGKATLARLGIKSLNGDAVLLAATFGQVTGLTKALDAVLLALGATTTIVVNAFKLFSEASRVLSLLFGRMTVVGGVIVLLITHWDQLKAAMEPIAGILNSLFGTTFLDGAKLATAAIVGLTTAFIALAASELGAGRALGVLGAGLTLLLKNPFARLMLLIVGQLLDADDAAKKFDKTTVTMSDKWSKFSEKASSLQPMIDKLKELVGVGSQAAKVDNGVRVVGQADTGSGVIQAPQSARPAPAPGAAGAEQPAQPKQVPLSAVSPLGNVGDTLTKVKHWLDSDQTDALGIGKAFQGLASSVSDWAERTTTWLEDLVGRLDKVKNAASSASSALSDAKSSSDSDSGEGAPKFEHGGLLGGRSGTDTNLGWFTRGEYIHPVRAVQHYGTRFMNAVRTMQFPKYEFGGLVGGLSGSLAPRYADGGPVVSSAARPDGRPFTLVMPDGTKFEGMRIEDRTITRMHNYAVDKGRRSTGRPGWFD